MKAKITCFLILCGLLAGLLLGVGHIAGAIVLVVAAVGGVWSLRAVRLSPLLPSAPMEPDCLR